MAAFRFLDNHGQNVVLSNNQQTAQYQGDVYIDGVVMSRDSMEINKLYEVHITRRDQGEGTLHVGVMTSSLDSQTPPGAAGGWRRSVFVQSDCFIDHGHRRDSDVGQALRNLPVDSRAGVSLDPSRRLHLHVNGVDQGVVPCRPLPNPCWAMWELNCCFREVKTLPVTHVP